MSFFRDLTRELFGGSKSEQSSKSNIDPRLMDAFLENWRSAKGTASRLDPRTVLPAGETLGEGMDFLRGAAETGRDYTGQATSAARDTIGRSAPTVEAGQFGGEGFSRYMNPATDHVVDTTMADLDRQRQLVQQQNEDAAVRAGAFGGSRHGVVEAETNRGFADVAARTAAGLRSQAFDQAAGLQQGDLNRALAADQATADADLRTRGIDLTGAGLMGEIGETTRRGGMESGIALANLGLTEREFEQEQLDADRALETERQRLRNEALGIAPAGGAGTVSKSRGMSRGNTGAFNALGNFFGGIS